MPEPTYQPHFFPEEEQLRRAREPFISHFKSGFPILDLGCGRGEVLRLMVEHQLDAVGVESDPALVDVCRQHGLKVELSDVLTFLGKQRDGGWGGVFIGHLIEHLSNADVYKMIDGVYRALEPGGRVVILTPNPNWLPGVGEFWSDPTHIRPWPISAITSLLESNGFSIVDAGVDPATRLRPNWKRPVHAIVDLLRLLLLRLIVLRHYNGGEIYIVAEKP